MFEAHGPSRGRSPSSEIRALEGGHGHRPASRYQWLWPTTWRLWGFWTLPELRLSSRRYLVDEVSGSYSARAGGRRRFGSVQPFRHSRPVRSWTPTRRLASQLVSPICTSRKYPPAHAAASQVPEPCEPFGSRSPSHPLSWGVATTTRTEDLHHGASSPRRLRPRCSVRASPRLQPRNPYPRRRASGGGITWP